MDSMIVRQKLYGLLELDSSGTVLYSRIERDGDSGGTEPDITGRNFFTEVAPFKNIKEFQRCIDSFRRSMSPADSLTFTCQFDDDSVPVRVLLARIGERSESERTKSILVHIRKMQYSIEAQSTGQTGAE